MKIKNVVVTKDDKEIIHGATGSTDNGKVMLEAGLPPGLKNGDRVRIKGDDDFDRLCTFMDEKPSGTLNFKID